MKLKVLVECETLIPDERVERGHYTITDFVSVVFDRAFRDSGVTSWTIKEVEIERNPIG